MTFGNCLYEALADKYYKDKSLYTDVKRKLFEGFVKLDYRTKNNILKKLNLKNDQSFFDKFQPEGSHGTDYTCIILSRELNICIVVNVVEERVYTIYNKEKDPVNVKTIPDGLLYIIIRYYNHHYS